MSMNNPYPYNYEYAEAYKLAERRVKARAGFYWHLAVYLVVNSFLFGIYLVNSLVMGWFSYPWFLWPLAGWGIGLLLNFLAVFIMPDSPERRQQMIARELGRMNYPAQPTYPPYPVQPPVASSPNHNNVKEEVLTGKGKQGEG